MKSEGIQIRARDLLHAMFKFRILIAVLTAGGLVTGLVVSAVSALSGEVSKKYAVSSSVAVIAVVSNENYSSNNAYPTRDDFYLAEDMVESAMYVLQSDTMLNKVLKALDLPGVSVKDIQNNLNMTRYEETQIIEIVLYWRDAEEGIAILNTLQDTSAEVLQETLTLGGVRVINGAGAKYLPGGSLNAALCILLALLGLLVGVGIAVLELIIRPTLLNTRDVEEKFGLELLGEIPTNDAYFRRKRSLLIRSDEDTDIADSFASLAHIVNNRTSSRQGYRCIYVTSAARGEGRTMAVANLAIQLSDMEKRILMIDFDLNNPQLGRMFLDKIEYERSLNALYRGEINEMEAITKLSGYLDLLPAVVERGNVPLDSTMFALVRKLARNYDYVLIDASPVGLDASMLSLNEIATAALFLARYDMTPLQEIRETLEKMDKSGVRVLGCVVNGVRASDNRRQSTAVQRSGNTSKGENREDFAAGTPEEETSGVFRFDGETDDGDVSEGPGIPGEEDSLLPPDATSDDFAEMLFRTYQAEQRDTSGEKGPSDREGASDGGPNP